MSHAPAILDPELADRIASLTFRARRVAEGLLTGLHASRRHGAGVSFTEHRPYRPGDDPRLLDWKAFGRTDRHRIKLFERESHLRALLMLDRSGSMAYPTDARQTRKVDYAAALLAVLAYVILDQGDSAGALSFDRDIHALVPCRSRRSHLREIFAVLSEAGPFAGATRLVDVLREVPRVAPRRAVLIIASDLLDPSFAESARALSELRARGHTAILFHVLHPDEVTFPFSRPVRVHGLEGEATRDVDPSLRAAYQRSLGEFLTERRRLSAAAGARCIVARTDEPLERALAAALHTPLHWGGHGF